MAFGSASPAQLMTEEKLRQAGQRISEAKASVAKKMSLTETNINQLGGQLRTEVPTA